MSAAGREAEHSRQAGGRKARTCLRLHGKEGPRDGVVRTWGSRRRLRHHREARPHACRQPLEPRLADLDDTRVDAVKLALDEVLAVAEALDHNDAHTVVRGLRGEVLGDERLPELEA